MWACYGRFLKNREGRFALKDENGNTNKLFYDINQIRTVLPVGSHPGLDPAPDPGDFGGQYVDKSQCAADKIFTGMV